MSLFINDDGGGGEKSDVLKSDLLSDLLNDP